MEKSISKEFIKSIEVMTKFIDSVNKDVGKNKKSEGKQNS